MNKLSSTPKPEGLRRLPSNPSPKMSVSKTSSPSQAAAFTSDRDEERLLQQHLTAAKVHGSQMKLELEAAKLMESLKHCSGMLNELRTSALYPKSYYTLCKFL
jgi:hypothetical protein